MSTDAAALLGSQDTDGIAPLSGYGREAWVTLLSNLTAAFAEAAERSGSPARPWLPGADEARVIEGLEGFARMSAAWGAWLGNRANPNVLSARGRTVDVLALTARGFLDGTNPETDFWWGEFADRDQRIVEAAELATGLWLGRDRIVPALGDDGLRQVLAWLNGIHGRAIYNDNWYLFPVMVALVQRALGWPIDDKVVDRGIDWMVDKYRGDGWYADGPGHAFDLYTGWAIHWHLMFWARMDGARRPRLARLVEKRFESFLRTYVAMVAPDGSRPLFGRSLGYRFAFAAPISLAALLGVDALRPGLARRAATAVIAHDVFGGAIDRGSGWLLRGVGGERPDVCERYISRGAAAWAAHSLVALGLPVDSPFWADAELPLPSETDDGSVCLSAPGFLVGWRATTGDTALFSGLADHPRDIPGHDYAPFYGKLAYRSAFPLSVRSTDGGATPDGTLLLEFRKGRDTRRKVDAGGAGPSWIWSEYRVGKGKDRCSVKAVVFRADDGIEVRVTGIQPQSAVRASEAPAALATLSADEVTRGIDADGTSWVSDGVRYVAIRSLLGYDEAAPSAPATAAGPDRNLVFDHAEQPVARERQASDDFRVLVTASCAVSRARPSLAEIEVDRSASDHDGGQIAIRVGDRERVVVSVDGGLSSSLTVAGREVNGESLRVVRAANDGSAWAGESVAAIVGVLQLERPGPVAVRRVRDGGSPGVDVWTMSGISLDGEWTDAPLTNVEIGDLDGWREAGVLDEANVVPDALVRRLQKQTERTLLHLRLT